MIIFDLDGTLANCEHRRHFVDPEKNPDYEYSNFGRDPITREMVCDYVARWHRKDNWDIKFKPDWESFYGACDKDEPILPVIKILNQLAKGHEIQIWSGRCESVREKTSKWIEFNCFPFSVHSTVLKMRPIDDKTPLSDLKKGWLMEYCEEKTRQEGITGKKAIDFVFESDSKSIEMWNNLGIFVFNCCQHNEEF